MGNNDKAIDSTFEITITPEKLSKIIRDYIAADEGVKIPLRASFEMKRDGFPLYDQINDIVIKWTDRELV